MKCLYISDLDGTLLRSDATISEYTAHAVNSLTERGMIFSYATARSQITAKKVTKGIHARIPLIVYNGAFIIDNVTEEILAANYFGMPIQDVLDDMFANGLYPIVYAYIDGVERFSFIPERCTRGMVSFLNSRKGDRRIRTVAMPEELRRGGLFYITCIDEPCRLEPFYEKYREEYHCVYQRDIYTGEQWLEIMPMAAKKSNAVIQLKKISGCDRVIAFGDGRNDIDMFEAADECYAVANAHDDLKEKATAVIGSNDEDGVARWLLQNAEWG